MLYRTLKPNVLTQEELQEIFDSIDFELAEKRNVEKQTEMYKQKYRVVKSKRIPRLSQIDIDFEIDEVTRKQIIQKYFELIRRRHREKSLT